MELIYPAQKCPSSVGSLYNRSIHGLGFHRPSLRFFKETISCSQSLYRRDLLGHYGCVNAIEFSSNGKLIASGGDDRRLLIWDIWKTVFDSKVPSAINTQHISNINTCSFDTNTKTVATGGNDGQVIVHDIATLKSTSVFGLSDAVFCLSPDPINYSIIATASDDGKIQILDTRLSVDNRPFTLADCAASMHSVMFNPSEPRILATANSKNGVALWDIRRPRRSLSYKSSIQNCMSVRFNSRGDQLLVLRRRGSPVLYDVEKMHPICKFDYKTYYNACTLKSASFAGAQDEFVMSGSDDFCVYLWKIPNTQNTSYVNCEPQMILKGHRSIVNQVRYCPYNQMIISSGVEKVIKMWTPYSLPGSSGHLNHARRYGDDDELERNAYSHEEYIHMVLRAGSFLNLDYTNGNTEEEPCMIAFFDSLIQREVEQSVDESDYSTESDSSNIFNNKDREKGSQNRRLVFESEEEDDSEISNLATRFQSPTAVEGPPLVEVIRDSRSPDRGGNLFQPFDESSSDSASEVDGILSAMYNRYVHSRDESSNSGPTGKKISSVIAQRKCKDKTRKPRKICKDNSHASTPRVHLHANDELHLQDNARSMSILADVIDNFVDNLVASEQSSNQSASDTNERDTSYMSSSLHSNSNSSIFHSTIPYSSQNPQSTSLTFLCSNTSDSNSNANQGDQNDKHKRRHFHFSAQLGASSPHSSSSSSDPESELEKTRGKNLPRQHRKCTSVHPFRPQGSKTSSSSRSDSQEIKTPSRSNPGVRIKERSKCQWSPPSSVCNLSKTLDAKNDVSLKAKGSGESLQIKKLKPQVSTSATPSSTPSSSQQQLSLYTAPHNKSGQSLNSLRLHTGASNSLEIEEKIPVMKGVLERIQNGDQESGAEKEPVTFKKVRKSKGRQFRQHKKTDFTSSSDEENG